MLAPRIYSALLCLTLSSFGALPLRAQPSTAITVTVHVSDGTGKAIPNANVTVLPPPDAGSGEVLTKPDGSQSFDLEPGNYHLEISLPGFKTLSQDIQVDASGSHDFKFNLLHPGEECTDGCPAATPSAPKSEAPPTAPPDAAASPTYPVPGTLQMYATCQFQDDLAIAKIDSLPPGMTLREVDTSDGKRKIDIEAAMQVNFSYPAAGPYATAKVEKLPVDSYAQHKQWLIDNFRFLYNVSAGTVVNRKDLGPINGYEVRGFDHVKLDDEVLGFYVMFDDANHVVTTYSMLNQESAKRRFKTVKEYQQLRDQFLTAYTFCVRSNQQR